MCNDLVVRVGAHKEGAVLADDERALEWMKTHCFYSKTLINGPFLARVLASYAKLRTEAADTTTGRDNQG